MMLIAVAILFYFVGVKVNDIVRKYFHREDRGDVTVNGTIGAAARAGVSAAHPLRDIRVFGAPNHHQL
ncbi:MAG: hypothetical protein ACRD8U_15420, partial [Pyrinomonadaceae bacterium]